MTAASAAHALAHCQTMVIGAANQAAREGFKSAMDKPDEAVSSKILVPVANPNTAKNLITLAAALARSWDEPNISIVALHVRQIHKPSLLNVRRRSPTSGEEPAMQQAIMAANDAEVPVQAAWCTAGSAAAGILSVAESRPDIRLILLGRHGPLAFRRLRTTTDQKVARSAPADVAVLASRELDSVERILVPISGSRHARFGLRLAGDLTIAGHGARITALRVLPPAANDRRTESEESKTERLIGHELGSAARCVRIRVVRAQSVVAGVLNAAGEGYDLIILGASEQWFLRHWLFGAIPDRVAEQAPCSVLMVKKHKSTPISWLRRILKGVAA